MNQPSAYNAYQTNQTTEETVRETEARALLKCAGLLEDACATDCPRDMRDAAIQRNQELWTIFQVGLCEPDNLLPRDLKTLLLNISVYVDKTSFAALTETNVAPLQSLININRTLAAGLSKKAEFTPMPTPGMAANTSTFTPIST